MQPPSKFSNTPKTSTQKASEDQIEDVWRLISPLSRWGGWRSLRYLEGVLSGNDSHFVEISDVEQGFAATIPDNHFVDLNSLNLRQEDDLIDYIG